MIEVICPRCKNSYGVYDDTDRRKNEIEIGHERCKFCGYPVIDIKSPFLRHAFILTDCGFSVANLHVGKIEASTSIMDNPYKRISFPMIEFKSSNFHSIKGNLLSLIIQFLQDEKSLWDMDISIRADCNNYVLIRFYPSKATREKIEKSYTEQYREDEKNADSVFYQITKIELIKTLGDSLYHFSKTL